MLSYFNSPFGMIDTYDLCIRLGLVFGVIAQAIYLCKKKGISKFFLLLVSYYGVMIIGSFAAKVMRGINDGLLDGRLSFGVFKNTMSGSHFLGYIIVFAFLYFPAMIFVKQFFVEVFGIEICDSDEYLWIGEGLSIALPIQHIANRTACLMRGCCYGIHYEGAFSIELPANPDVTTRVFPSQALEILGMVILLAVVVVLLKKERHIFGAILMGFALTFFISEFTLENPSASKHFGMTFIQFFSVFVFVLGVAYYIIINKIENRDQNHE